VCLPTAPLQAAAKTNDLAGDGTTTATILSAAMIAEGMKIVAAGANPVQVCRSRPPLPCLLLSVVPHCFGSIVSQVSYHACWLLWRRCQPVHLVLCSPNNTSPCPPPSLAALQLIRGMDKTVDHLVGELKKLSKEVTDEELKDVATVSAGGNEKVGDALYADCS
jgi:hypothetical protein